MSDDERILAARGRRPDRTAPPDASPEHVIDIWEPAPQVSRTTTVVLIHGGFWRAAYDRHHLEPLAAALADSGFHVANVEYPRVGMPGGGWPGTLTSLKRSVSTLAADPRLPDRLVAVGHSAGGHLALWLGSDHHCPALDGVVALAPAADLREVDRLDLSQGAAREFVGAAPHDAADAWAEADPALARTTAPSTIITGSDDDIVPISVIESYLRTRLREDDVEHRVVPGADHFTLIDPQSPAYSVLLASLG